MISAILIIEGTFRACFASYIDYKCIGGKVNVAGSVEEGQIKFSTFISQILGHERRDEEPAISRKSLSDDFLQLCPNLGDSQASVDRLDLCDEELFVPIHGDGQYRVSFWIGLFCGPLANVYIHRLQVNNGLQGGDRILKCLRFLAR